MTHISDYVTPRLLVRHWAAELAEPARRREVEQELAAILTVNVLAPLPPSMQVGDQPDAIANWIDTRVAESDVYLISERASGDVIGLMILVCTTEVPAAYHLGYLFAEPVWGQGFATELLRGLVHVARTFAPVTVMGGVGVDNPASAKVLTRVGFVKNTSLSDEGTEMFVLTIA